MLHLAVFFDKLIGPRRYGCILLLWCGLFAPWTVHAADLRLSLETTPGSPVSGQNFTYTLSVFAVHSANASATSNLTEFVDDVLLSYVVPANFQLISAQSSQGDCGGTTLITCNLGALQVESTIATVTLVLQSNRSGTTVSTFDARGTTRNDTGQEVFTTTSMVISTDISGPKSAGGLSMSVSASPVPALVGQPLVYSVNLTPADFSAAPVAGVTLVYTLPDSFVLQAATSAQGGCAESSGAVRCDLGEIGGTRTAAVEFILIPGQAGTVTGRFSAGGTTEDSTGNSAHVETGETIETTIEPVEVPPDTGVYMNVSASAEEVAAGQEFTYTVSMVPKDVPADAQLENLSLIYPQPASFLITAATSSQGGCTSDALLRCDLGNLAGNTAATVTIKITPAESGFFDDLFTVSGSFTDSQGRIKLLSADASAGVEVVALPASPTVGFGQAEYEVTEAGGAVVITVIRAGDPDSLNQESSVEYTTQDGSAKVEDKDYVATDGKLSWVAGSSEPQTIRVEILEDTEVEEDETISLVLKNPQGAGLSTGNAQVVVSDNETPARIGFSAAEYTFGEKDAEIELEVERSGASTGQVIVEYAAKDGSARAGEDFHDAAGTIRWADGDSAPKTIRITLKKDDSGLEGEQKFSVKLTKASNRAEFTQAAATVTLLDNISTVEWERIATLGNCVECELPHVSLQEKNLSTVNFKGANLYGSSWRGSTLTDADFTFANLEYADFQYASLGGAKFVGANLMGADFTKADLENTVFENSDLTGASFKDAFLEGARFEDVDMRWADLGESRLDNAMMIGTRLDGANIDGVHDGRLFTENTEYPPPPAPAGEHPPEAQPVSRQVLDPEQILDLPPEKVGQAAPQLFAAIPPEVIENFSLEAVANFTAEQISNLAPEAAAAFTAEQLGSVRNSAIGGLTPEQMKAIDAAGIAALSDLQFAGLTADTVAALDAEQFQNLTTDALSRINAEQLAAFAPEVLSFIGAEQLAHIPPAAMAGLQDKQASSLKAEALEGMSLEQFDLLSPQVRSRLTPDQRAALPAELFALRRFTAEEVANLSANAVARLTPEQIRVIAPEAWQGFRDVQMAALNAAAMAGFSADRIAEIPPPAFNTLSSGQLSQIVPEALSGLNGEQLAMIPAEAFNGISAGQIRQIAPAAMSALSALQAGEIPDLGMIGFDAAQIRKLPPATVFGFDLEQTLNLDFTAANAFDQAQKGELPIPLAVMQNMRSADFDKLLPKDLERLVPAQVAQLPAAVFAEMRAEHVRNLAAEVWGAIDSGQLAALPSAVLSAFGADQIKRLLPEALQGIELEQFASLSGEALGALGAGQLSEIPAEVLSGAGIDSLEQIAAEALRGVTPGQLQGFADDQLTRLLPDQRAALADSLAAFGVDPGGLSDFTLDDVSKLSFDSIGAMVAEQVAEIAPQALAGLRVEQFLSFADEALGGLDAEQIRFLTSEVLNGTPPADAPAGRDQAHTEKLQALRPESLRGLSGEQIAGMRTDAFAKFTAAQMNALLPQAWQGVTPEQIGRLPAVVLAGFEADQLGAVAAESFAAFSADQLATLAPDALGGMKAEQMASLADKITAFDPIQFAKLSSDAVSGITAEQFEKLSDEVLGASTPENVGGFSAAVLRTFTQATLDKFDEDALIDMPDAERARFLVNLNPDVSAVDIKFMLPLNWDINLETHELAVSAGIGLRFPPLEFAGAPDWAKELMPNFSAQFALGGKTLDGSGHTPLGAINQTLVNLDLGEFDVSQDDSGALKVEGPDGVAFSFLAAGEDIEQQPADTPPSVAENPNGAPGTFIMDSVEARRYSVSWVQSRGRPPADGLWRDPAGGVSPVVLARFRPSQLADLSPLEFARFGSAQVEALPADALAGLKQEQLQQLPASALAAFDAEQLAQITPHVLRSITPQKLAALPSAALAGLEPEQLEQIPAETLAALDAAQLAHIPPTTFKAMQTKQFKQLPAETLSGLRGAQLSALGPAHHAALDKKQRTALAAAPMNHNLDALEISELSGFSLRSVDKAAFAGLSAALVSELPADALDFLRADQIAALPSASLTGLGADQIRALEPETLAALSTAQLRAIPPTTLAALGADQLAALPADTVATLSAAQLGNLSADALAGMTPAQWNALPPAARASLGNLGGLAGETIQTITDAQLDAVPPTVWDSLSALDLAKFLVNLDPAQIDPTELAADLPAGWHIDPQTYALDVPPGAPLAFPPLDELATWLPPLPDFSRDFAFGGSLRDSDTPTPLQTIAETVQDAGPWQVEQTPDGILLFRLPGTLYSLMPLLDGMLQLDGEQTPTLGTDDAGRPFLVTGEDRRYTFVPMVADPSFLATQITGDFAISADGEIEAGSIFGSSWRATAAPEVQGAPEDLSPGLHFGPGPAQARLVYPWGGMQMLYLTD